MTSFTRCTNTGLASVSGITLTILLAVGLRVEVVSFWRLAEVILLRFIMEKGADNTQPAQAGAQSGSPTVSMWEVVPQKFGKPLLKS